jgi:hypothetical protein
MNRCVAVALVSVFSLSATAADWQVVADTKLGQLKMDKASVIREGKYTAAVLVYEFKELQRLFPSLAGYSFEPFFRRQETRQHLYIERHRDQIQFARARHHGNDGHPICLRGGVENQALVSRVGLCRALSCGINAHQWGSLQ